MIVTKEHGETELKNAKTATCTAEGYTGDKVCKNCGEIVEAGKKVVKIAHTYKDGKCIVCGAIDSNYYKPSTQLGAITDTSKDNPQTGNNSNIALYFIMMFVTGVGLTGTAVYSRKRKSIR